ncbi:protein SPT2 homolog [Ornithodoros turicata]|uniref:protein SPT2 homolog n=1 Tax=Ornithodoros turicata TaxID=34597 RepID=UPI003138CAE9
MNFGHLLNVAEKNRSVATVEKNVRRYTTEVAPAKKPPKSNVQSAAIRAFLQRKEQEEKQKALDEQRKKEKLLELRAQSTKSNKRAKLMASRTKDNDFSRIRLTEDEEEMRRKREMELHRKMLTDKVERMKARIALQQQEESMPHKRKRRRHSTEADGELAEQKPQERKPRKRKYELYTGEDEPKEEKKPRPVTRPPPPPIVDYHDLLKIAKVKQHEPVQAEKVVEKPKEESRPLTKREKERRMEEELHRKGVKLQSLPPIKKKSSTSSTADKKPGRDQPNGKTPPSKVPHSSKVANSEKGGEKATNGCAKQSLLEARAALEEAQRRFDLEQRRLKEASLKAGQDVSSTRDDRVTKKPSALNSSKNPRPAPSSTGLAKTKKTDSKLDEDTYYAYSNKPKSSLQESRSKSGLPKHMGAPSTSRPAPPVSKGQKPGTVSSSSLEKRRAAEQGTKSVQKAGSSAQKPRISPEELQRRREMALRMKEKLQERKMSPPPEKKKKSYEEQYEDLYRRLQGTQYIESEEEGEDDEYEDEEDDLDGFIDDGPTSEGLDYSEHIREIFGYDRRKFADFDDDEEALESSYAQQMKEEVRSARIGLKEDIEDMKREEEELRRKQLKKLENLRRMRRKLR